MDRTCRVALPAAEPSQSATFGHQTKTPCCCMLATTNGYGTKALSGASLTLSTVSSRFREWWSRLASGVSASSRPIVPWFGSTRMQGFTAGNPHWPNTQYWPNTQLIRQPRKSESQTVFVHVVVRKDQFRLAIPLRRERSPWPRHALDNSRASTQRLFTLASIFQYHKIKYTRNV